MRTQLLAEADRLREESHAWSAAFDWMPPGEEWADTVARYESKLRAYGAAIGYLTDRANWTREEHPWPL